jgi:hypothetical protein
VSKARRTLKLKSNTVFVCCTDVHQVLNEVLIMFDGELCPEENHYVAIGATTYVLLSIIVKILPWEYQGRW